MLGDDARAPGSDASAEVAESVRQGDVVVLAGLHLHHAVELPAAEDGIQDPAPVQQSPAAPEREIHEVPGRQPLAHVGGIRSALAREAGRILNARLAADELLGSVADAMRPRVRNRPHHAAGKALAERGIQAVVIRRTVRGPVHEVADIHEVLATGPFGAGVASRGGVLVVRAQQEIRGRPHVGDGPAEILRQLPLQAEVPLVGGWHGEFGRPVLQVKVTGTIVRVAQVAEEVRGKSVAQQEGRGRPSGGALDLRDEREVGQHPARRAQALLPAVENARSAPEGPLGSGLPSEAHARRPVVEIRVDEAAVGPATPVLAGLNRLPERPGFERQLVHPVVLGVPRRGELVAKA